MKKVFRRLGSGRASRDGRGARLRVENLEDRTVLSTFVSTDVPKTIEWGNVLSGTPTISEIHIGDNVNITDLNVQLNITIEWEMDVSIILVSPGGTHHIPLWQYHYDNGYGENFQNTIFDDEADVWIGDPSRAFPPFDGSYQPDGSLSAVNGTSALGTWQLWVWHTPYSAFLYNDGSLNSWSLTIGGSQSPPTPTLSINDQAVTEGDDGTVYATFPVSLSAASDQTVTVDYATADGTATAGSDYQSRTGTLTFTAGSTEEFVTVPVYGDTLDEANETFFVNLSNPTNATITDNQGQGTIIDNDPLPAISIADTTVTEGSNGTVYATFPVSLSAVSGRAITVNYTTADGTATAGSDYQSRTGTLTFTAGATEEFITVPVYSDSLVEPDETFFVNLSNPVNATITDNQGQGTIHDGESLPTISIQDVSRAEGNSGTTSFDFAVSLSKASSQTVTVRYATANGTATTRNKDYLATSGTLTFNPGETSKVVTVAVRGDTRIELDETFFVNLSGPTGATILDGQGVGTIVNDDGTVLIRLTGVGDRTSLRPEVQSGMTALGTLSHRSSTAKAIARAVPVRLTEPAIDVLSPLGRLESALDELAAGLLRPARRRR